MQTKVDYLGDDTRLTGAVIAQTLLDAGRDVLMLDHRIISAAMCLMNRIKAAFASTRTGHNIFAPTANASGIG